MDRFEFYSALPRSVPGGPTFTSAYLTQVQIRASDVLLELGCGGGDLCTWVARSRGCRVIAVDQDPRNVAIAGRRAEEGGAGHLILPLAASYTQLPFPDQAFRLVIAEGPAMQLGLKQALTLWRRLISRHGHLALTYPGVVNKDAPAEVRGPLEQQMVESLGTLADYHQVVRSAGYEVVHQVPLQHDLWDAFYTSAVRHAWAKQKSGGAAEEDPVVRGVLDESRWYRRIGRGRIFLQAMVLRRTR